MGGSIMIITLLYNTNHWHYSELIMVYTSFGCLPNCFLSFKSLLDQMQGKGNDILKNNSKGKFPHNPFPLFLPLLTHPSSVTHKKQDILPPYFKRFRDFL